MQDVTKRFADRAAIADWCAAVDDTGSWSARQLLAEAEQLAKTLEVSGPSAPTLLVQAENSRRMVVAGLAVGLLGGTLALASAHLSACDLADVLDDIRPDHLIADPVQLAQWRVDATGNEVDVLNGWCVQPCAGSPLEQRWKSGVVIGMTSGSTGRSKGVVHSEESIRYAARQEIAAAGLEAGDAIGVIVALSAAPAFAFGIYCALELQSAVVMSAEWEPAGALEWLADNEVRWLMCVPTQVLQLAAAARDRPGVLAGMKALTVGGGPMEVRALAEAEDILGVRLLRVFGMAECLGHTSPALQDPPDIRLGRDGRPFPGTELRSVNELGDHAPLGLAGRAQVRGPSLFLGYAKGGRVHPPELTPDGFFETGDLIAKHADGTIKVMGRIKDVIIRGGRNISVAEVENAVRGDSRIEEVCVVPVPDAVLGERVAALVVTDDPSVSLFSVCEHLQQAGLAKIKWPEFVITVAEIPRTHVGKVSRVQAREVAVGIVAGGIDARH